LGVDGDEVEDVEEGFGVVGAEVAGVEDEDEEEDDPEDEEDDS